MDCDALRDDQWERIKGFVPGGTQGQARSAHKQSAISGCAAVDGALSAGAGVICRNGSATIDR